MKSNIEKINKVVEQAPWLTGINTKEEYDSLIKLMDELVLDHKKHENLINLLALSIEDYEKTGEQFSEFNNSIQIMTDGTAALITLKDQYNLTFFDFKNEIGDASEVSRVINGERNLTLAEIMALSHRFNVPISIFTQ